MSLHVRQDLVATSASREYVVETESLLQQLIKSIDPQSDTPLKVLRRTDEHVDEIVFEVDVDGTHYYLVRCRSSLVAHASLSPRELAIARLIARGMPNKCIGDILEISQWTVATHLRRIFTKLDVTSRAAMVARLGEENLL